MYLTSRYSLKWISIILLVLTLVFLTIAMLLYPGGHPGNLTTSSFSLKNNYLCNLFNDHALNGLENNGKYLAILGSIALAFSFVITFYLIPFYLEIQGNSKKYIHLLGMTSMFISCFISSSYHDTVINVSGTLGTISLGMIFYYLHQKKHYLNFTIGMLSIFSCALTYFIYYTKYLFDLLGIMQKLSLLLLIIWMIDIHIKFRLKPI